MTLLVLSSGISSALIQRYMSWSVSFISPGNIVTLKFTCRAFGFLGVV